MLQSVGAVLLGLSPSPVSAQAGAPVAEYRYNGLGHRIIDAQQVLNVKTMYAAILAAGALGYALNVLFLVIERRIVHWSGR